MFRIRIILMLSAIIPSLDCCSSRTLIEKNPIDLYRTMELSMEKTTQFDQEAPSPPAQVTTAAPSNLSHHGHHHHHHSHRHSQAEAAPDVNVTDDEGDNLNLNRSHAAQDDLLPLETPQPPQSPQPPHPPQQHLQPTEQRRLVANGSTLTDDGQYKFMDEIIVLECGDWYRLEFCLNGGRCFLYPILNHTLYSCECAGDYVGERCEAQTPEKIPPTIRPRFVLAKTIGGPLVLGLAFMDILLLLFLFCKNSHRN